MPQNNPQSLWDALKAGGDLSASFLMGANHGMCLKQMLGNSVLGGRVAELRDRSVLILSADQFHAALALIELDGIARRMVLYPPELSLVHLPYVMRAAEVEAIVSDRESLEPENSAVGALAPALPPTVPLIQIDITAAHPAGDRGERVATEWILLTSGTTGLPKMVQHSFASLTGAIEFVSRAMAPIVWSTFYDIRRYGGLQIFLRAIATGTSLVLVGAHESAVDFLSRAGTQGVTHISGTPSHWRRALMSPEAHSITPDYIRLSGEVADQGVLNSLHSFYPLARIGHAFATTEAGVAFDVNDGLAGFPASVVENTPGVEMKVVDRTLRIRSSRTATRYLGENAPVLKDADGFVDTADVIELRDGRYHFFGRRDGIINVGGQKVYPEEVEAVINRHPDVQVSLVRTKKNPITGALVIADVVLKTIAGRPESEVREVQKGILMLCRESLASHKVPILINFVPTLAVAESGKLIRRHA
jgi:acyl-coenzyme A synthetase/AMP-(fatty) acid ligase